MNHTKQMLAAATLGLAASGTQALVIDNFMTAQSLSVATAAPSSISSSVLASEALGGERDLLISKTTGVDDERVRGRINALGDGFLRVSIDIATGSVSSIWDGLDGNPDVTDFDGLGGLDLLSNSGSAFELGVEASDIGGPMRIKVWDADDPTGNTFAEGTINVGSAIASVDPTVFESLNFSSFNLSNATNFASIFDSVGAIQLTVDASSMFSEGWDVSLSFFGTNATTPASATAVTEPISYALLGLGFIGMLVSRRRNNH